ncbi:MAG TPA: 50S ribosomal protein L11 methyltransferase [Blastocatellia bacterium]|nr:50S ribosomal protein L11 methyltransferase [Blastocatellia bacterium]
MTSARLTNWEFEDEVLGLQASRLPDLASCRIRKQAGETPALPGRLNSMHRRLQHDMTSKNPQSATLNSGWWLLTLALTRDVEGFASALLFDLGSTGIVTLDESEDRLTLGAYFESRTDPDGVKQALEAGFARAGSLSSLIALSVSQVPHEDWMQKWKEGFEAISVGRRLIVAPSWKVPEDNNGRVVIQIDPGMAFGTGTHETTRLCLEAIERHWKGGSLLDVGTGTGILAIAAAKLVPGSRVLAIDIDPQAVEVARENAAINGVSASIELSEAQPRDFAGQAFDVLVANLTAEVIIGLAGDLAGCLSRRGIMILSGILTGLAADVERALSACGFTVIERSEAGEWCALVGARKSGL